MKRHPRSIESEYIQREKQQVHYIVEENLVNCWLIPNSMRTSNWIMNFKDRNGIHSLGDWEACSLETRMITVAIAICIHLGGKKFEVQQRSRFGTEIRSITRILDQPINWHRQHDECICHNCCRPKSSGGGPHGGQRLKMREHLRLNHLRPRRSDSFTLPFTAYAL